MTCSVSKVPGPASSPSSLNDAPAFRTQPSGRRESQGYHRRVLAEFAAGVALDINNPA
jgi:hypothetical protein